MNFNHDNDNLGKALGLDDDALKSYHDRAVKALINNTKISMVIEDLITDIDGEFNSFMVGMMMGQCMAQHDIMDKLATDLLSRQEKSGIDDIPKFEL